MSVDDRTDRLRKQLRIYLISPEGWGERPGDEERLAALIEAGVSAVQFREKAGHPERLQRAERMRDIVRAHGALFIVNDSPQLAQDLDADGVHVGVDDVSVAEARRILGPDKLVGASARTIERAHQALHQGADYLGMGAIFDATASKSDAKTIGLDGLRALRDDPALQNTPIVAIGGVTLDTAKACMNAGANGVAMMRGLWSLDDLQGLKALRHLASVS